MDPSPDTRKAVRFMDLALEEARAAARMGEVPVGAVLVRDGVVLGTAGNRTRTHADPTAHAEMLLLRKAGAERLVGADLFVTLEPCAMCAGAISLARIKRLYFGAEDPKGGAVEHGPRFFTQPTCHHRPEVYSGFAQEDCAALLRAFFAERRD